MSEQLKSMPKKINYFILGLVLLIVGGALLGYGIGMIFSENIAGIYIGLGIALVISSFMFQIASSRIFNNEIKTAEREFKAKEQKNLREMDKEKQDNSEKIYTDIISKVLDKFGVNPKMPKKIDIKIGK